MEYISHNELYDQRLQEVLRDLNECDSACEPLGMVSKNFGSSSMTDWMMDNVPVLPYAMERIMNYIFSNGMTTGVQEQEETLTKWLYESRNTMGSTNYSTLREAIRLAHTYGESGLRWYEDNLYLYKKGYFGLIIGDDDGVEKILAAYVRKDRKKVSADIFDDDWGDWDDVYGVLRYFDEKGLILLDMEDFCLLRNNTSELHGTPIFSMDKQRVQLLLHTYQRLNYDIDYDGPGRFIFFENGGFLSNPDNTVSTTTEVLNNSPTAKSERSIKAKEEIRQIAKDVKTAGSDAIGVVSKVIDPEHILKIPRVTKATEFFNWISLEGEMVAQVVGMSPILLETGKLHGNVSMAALIDNAMLNSIVPLREKYAIQFSDFIARKIGVAKVYFNKYDMRQIEDENDERGKVATVIMRLSNAMANNDSEILVETVNNLTAMINNSLHEESGDLRPI